MKRKQGNSAKSGISLRESTGKPALKQM